MTWASAGSWQIYAPEFYEYVNDHTESQRERKEEPTRSDRMSFGLFLILEASTNTGIRTSG